MLASLRGAWSRLGEAALEWVGLWCGACQSMEVALQGEGSQNLKNVLGAVALRGCHFVYPRAILTKAALVWGSTAGPQWAGHPCTLGEVNLGGEEDSLPWPSSEEEGMVPGPEGWSK